MYKLSKLTLFILIFSSCSGNQSFRVQKDRDYTVRPGDVIRIEVRNYPEYNQKLLVDFSGGIKTEVGGDIFVSDFTVQDLEVAITSEYRRFLVKPVVHAEIFSKNEKTVYVAGKINKPGVIRYKSGLTVAQSIGLAGGIGKLSRNYCAYVLRKKTDGNWTKFKIPLKTKADSLNDKGAFKLAPYDIVYVTQSTETDAGDLIYGSGFGTEI